LAELREKKGIVLKQSNNIFEDILTPLAERGDGYCVYFYRILGCDDEQRYLAEIAGLDKKLRGLGLYSLFDKILPMTTEASLIEKTRNLIKQVAFKDFGNGMLANILQTNGYFSLTQDQQANLQIRDAFQRMMDLYLRNQTTVNLNIVGNFVIKVLCWFVEYGKILSGKSNYNPKLVFWGSPTVHDIYFLILMSWCGCDVLVLNPTFQDDFEQVDKLNEFCFLLKYSRGLPIKDFPRIKEEKLMPPAKPCQEQGDILGIKPIRTEDDNTGSVAERFLRMSKGLVCENVLVVKLAKPMDIFADILTPINQRSGFVGEPFPILPAYFIRYTGVPDYADDREIEYDNQLFNLDQKLQATGFYLKFQEGIPAPDITESALISRRLQESPCQDRLEALIRLVSTDLFPRTQVELLNNTIKKVFVDMVNLFAKHNSQLTTSVLFNFSLKMIVWFQRYLPLLYNFSKNDSRRQTSLDYKHNPKILFYGDIKLHEIYLLNAFHQIGCDVLFVHSQQEGDRLFRSLDTEDSLGTLIQNEYNLPLGAFPKTERLVRKSTVAYNASRQIEEVLYGEDVGLFKPWQFESYHTEPLTLKTTYDELKILWSEPAKIRPEFKVQNQKVYIPNLFAKINGVSENIDTYWQDLKTLTMTPHAKLIENVPFTRVAYTKQQLFEQAYLLNTQGLIDEAVVMKSARYRFGYLKLPLQHLMLAKINELILSEMLVASPDEKLSLKILMTVLTMDDSILRLIEVFDYPQEIPKLIIYDSQRYSFSEEDALLIAYLNLIGADIVIFTPTNYSTIERYIKPVSFDVHQLPEVKFDLSLPQLDKVSVSSNQNQSFMSRLFNFRQK